MKKRLLTIFLILASVAGLMVLGFAGCTQVKTGDTTTPTAQPAVTVVSFITAEGIIAPQESSNLAFMLGGQVSEVNVKVGDQVAQGDVLARIGDIAALQAALSGANFELFNAEQALADLQKNSPLITNQKAAAALQAQRDLIQAQQALSNLDTREYQTQVDDARQKVLDTEKTLKDRQADSDKVKDFAKDNPVYKTADQNLKDAQKAYNDAVYTRDLLVNQLNLAQANVTLAQTRLDDAQRQATAALSGPDPDVRTQLEKRLENAKAQVAAAQMALERASLTAPFAGSILKVDIKTGETAIPGQPVMILADVSQWYVDTTDLAEKEVVKVAEGQDVRIIPDALADLTLHGRVESISQIASNRAGDVTYTVRIKLDESDPRLRWGMTVEVRFEP